MKLFRMTLFLAMAALAVSCGSKQDRKEAPAPPQTTADAQLPDGYPAELALPAGFSAGDISVGEGTSSGGGKAARTYASYRLEKVAAGDKSALVEHYRKLLAENGWQGEMKTPEPGYGSGTFSKGNMELELKMNDMLFSFLLRVHR